MTTPSRERMAEERRSPTGRKNAATANWTDERVALLKKLWGERLEYSQIALALGDGATKNSVAGKVRRLKLPDRRKPPKPRIMAEKKKHGTANKKGQSPFYRRGQSEAEARVLIMAARDRAHEFIAAAPIPAPTSEPVSLLDIGPHQCRFPLWAGDAPKGSEKLFCGAPVGEGAWCAFHRPIIYRDVNSREVYDEKTAVKIAKQEVAA